MISLEEEEHELHLLGSVVEKEEATLGLGFPGKDQNLQGHKVKL